MIVYSATKDQFMSDVLANEVEKKILTSFVREMGHGTSQSEINSWRNSMLFMNNIVADPDIPYDAGVAIEYKIPRTNNRIDFILTGMSEEKRDTAILIELKQWSSAELTEKDAVVRTFVGHMGEHNHPSYQVWSYAMLLQDFNATVEEDDIFLQPCAYLHNYEPDNVITNDFYKEYLDKAPVFLKPDAIKLRDFIKRFVKYGDSRDILYRIEHGKIRPSKGLADSLASMLNNNKEFILIDDQKIVYETALKLAEESSDENKNVLIVEGGPGTGKSVVSINLLVELTNKKQIVQYVTRNSAPRRVYEAKLTGKLTKSRISNLFSSSGTFYNLDANTFDSLIVDEAHRLTEKSGMFSNLGENQVKELIDSSAFTVFFLDEDQRVTLKDIGSKDEISKWAEKLGATVTTMQLESQFRCNGSDGYLAWVDNALQIRSTANQTLDGIDYDFQVIDDPAELHTKIKKLNEERNSARLLAGYCWKWISQKNFLLKDIVIGDYQATWNLYEDGQAWLIKPNSVDQVGCIHTSQGLDLDYVGVIIGPDLIVRNGKVVTDAPKRASSDNSIKGYKKMYKEDPELALALGDEIIKNTYRTLVTRGMKGCYIYCTDPETQAYFKQALQKPVDRQLFTSSDIGASITE